MRVFVVAVALLCAMIEASTVLDTSMNCSAVWEDNKQRARNSTGGTVRLMMLHHQHPCSPVRHQEDPPFSWHRSRTLDRERQLAARLFFRRRPAPPTNVSVPVTSAGTLYGFVAQVTLGTPATTQTVLIDSAATYSWVQCAACAGSRSGCFKQDVPLFNAVASTTYRRLPCSSPYCLSATGNASAPKLCVEKKGNTCIYSVVYMDQSGSIGHVGTDTLTFGEEAFPGFVFGCSQGYTGRFGRYSGIFSFGNAKMSFFSQVVERTRQYRAFSYYLPSPTSVGYIQVGAYDEDGLAFTPMFTNGMDYYLALTSITVDGCPLDLTGMRFSSSARTTAVATACYLDLGATMSVLPSQLYQKLNDAVAERIKGYDRVQSSPDCFEPAFLSTERAIPVVRLQFSHGVQLVLDEHKLMSKETDGRLCLGFVSSDFCMLGSMQMQMIYAAQDVEKSRMGFYSS